jgi:hypothetical protein
VNKYINMSYIHIDHSMICLENSSIKKNEIVSFSTKRIDLKLIILSEISQTHNDKCNTFSLRCGVHGRNMNVKKGGLGQWRGKRGRW